MKKIVSIFIMLFILSLVCTSSQFINLAKANFLPPPPPTVQVYIRNDGSVEPATTPIQRVGNTYVFTDNLLNHTLEIQCDNIIVDGAGFTLKGVGVNAGITLSDRSNVTIKNLNIRNYVMSVWLNQSSNITITNNQMITAFNVILDSSSNNQITRNNITGQDTGYGYGVQVNWGSFHIIIIGNTFTDTGIGVRVTGGHYTTISENHFKEGGTSILLNSANHNIVSKNNMVDGRDGISIGNSSYNTISRNNITGKSDCGISIYHGSNNTVYENHVANNVIGVSLGIEFEIPGREVKNNVFYHNNFVNNTQYVFIGYNSNSNFWDNGKEGNYWSNYNGTDANGDGIADTPYMIDTNNIDCYPLMMPFDTSTTIPEFPIWTSMLIFVVILMIGASIFRKKLRKPTQ